jgi:ribosomal-protein-alanine N-acetyltransferase
MALVRIIPATATHLSSYLQDPQHLATLLGSPIPEGWPEFPEAIPFTLEVLEARPAESEWWMYFFVDDETDALVGSGGFAGAPSDGQVEIGYEIAPEFRRRGYATAAVHELINKAAMSGEVQRILAHTLVSDERSAGVLRAAGFTEGEHVTHPEDGELVRWRRSAI